MPEDKTILLVEDQAIIALNQKMILRQQGYVVEHVSTGEDAVAYFATGRHADLVLMDIDLGEGIDGPEAARQILASHDVPLAFLSAHTEAEIVDRTEDITSYGYIVKHSGETVLIASIRMAFRLYETRQCLRVQEQRLRWITESMEDVFWVCSADDEQILYVNPAYEQVWGHSRESLYRNPRSFEEAIHPYDRARVSSSTSPEKTFRVIRPDNEQRWINTRILPVQDEKGVVVAHTGVARDVTREMRFKRELILRDRELNTILADISEIVWSARWPELEVLMVSPSIAQLTGHTTTEFFDDPALWLEVLHRDDHPLLAKVRTMIVERGTFTMECRICHSDGVIIRVLIKGRLIRDDDGVPVRVAGSVTALDPVPEVPVLPEADAGCHSDTYRNLLY